MATAAKARQGPAEPAGRLAAAVRDLHPAYFAFVMASGIISTGTFLLGPSWLSRVLLGISIAGLVVLCVGLAARVIFFRPNVAADLQAPGTAFSFFSIGAALNVLGSRLAEAGHPLITAVLAAVAAVVWLVLTYGVLASLILRPVKDSVLGGINGTWLLLIVLTVSLSIAAATLLPVWPSQSALLAPLAVCLWGVGLILYLMVTTLILLHWLTVPMTPATLGPAYWILMGATAITVLAGARVISLPRAIPVVAATAGLTEGFSLALWAFGTWWIPLLVILGFWRHVRRQWPLTYDPSLWSIVFPLGMYSVASVTFGQRTGLAFMHPIGRVMLWVAVAAWVLVALAFVARLGGIWRPPTADPDT